MRSTIALFFSLFVQRVSLLCSKREEGQWDIHGIRVCGWGPSLTHLMYVDDCLLFCMVVPSEVEKIKSILSVYEKALGQAINMHKSQIYFSKNTCQEVVKTLGFKPSWITIQIFYSVATTYSLGMGRWNIGDGNNINIWS